MGTLTATFKPITNASITAVIIETIGDSYHLLVMRVSLPVRKNVRVDNYHRRFALLTGGDSPSSQLVCTTKRR
jgi:hypothetical protein